MSWISDGFRAVGGWVEDRVEQVGDWIGDRARSAWNWVSDNVSGVPLQFFSQMGSWFDGVGMLGTTYFKARHADADVNALLSGSKWDSG
ncbi:MAG TPA: hypothetical protein VIL09_06595 [Microvirga sp.]|jgi:hypothetical protein